LGDEDPEILGALLELFSSSYIPQPPQGESRPHVQSSHRDTVVHEQIVEAAFSMLRRPRSENRAILAMVRARLWRTWNESQVVCLAECA